MSTPRQAFHEAGLMTAARLNYGPAPTSDGVTVGDILRISYTDGEDAARRVWATLFPHDPDSFAVIMAGAREARAAAERRAAL